MDEQSSERSIWDLVALEMPREVRVSVVVVSYFAGRSFRSCLTALQCDDQVDEVIIVENGNSDFSINLLKEYCEEHPKFRMVYGHGNIGFAWAANLGARLATGDRILFLNPDAILRKGSIAALELAASDLKGPWIVGGRVFNCDGSEQKGGRRNLPGVFSSIATFANLGRFHAGMEGVNHHRRPVPDGPVSCQAVSGAMMYMSREGFERLDGFDAGYFLHVEDIDICRRAAEREGGEVVFTPFAGALHYGGTSRSSKFRVEWEKAKGFGRYFRKFAASPMTKVLATASVPLIAALLFSRIIVRQTMGGAGTQPSRSPHHA